MLGKFTIAALTLLQPSLMLSPSKNFFEFKATTITGKPANLKQYDGKVVMVVNVASKCGLTPQYEALEKLYLDNKEKGFLVVGFPANNFGHQEPGTNEEIAEFCSSKFNVTFPMMTKISVKGANIDPLYSWLIAESDRPGDDIEWNFAKFLIDKKGQVRYRFGPQTTPNDKNILAAIKVLTAEKARPANPR